MKGPLHIGLLSPGLAGVTGFDSGIAVHFRHLADALAGAGERVTVVIACEQAPLVPTDLPFAVRLAVVSADTPLFRLLGRFSWQLHHAAVQNSLKRRVRQVMQDVGADVWETTASGSPGLDYLRHEHKAPVLVRVSTTAEQLRSTNQGTSHWIDRKLQDWESELIRRADQVVTHSTSHKEHLRRSHGLPDLQLIPHGIPIPAPTQRTGRTGPCRLLFVGRFEHRKGIDLLLSALPLVLDRVPDLEVHLVGRDHNEHWKNQWLKTVSKPHQGRVHFAGVVDEACLQAHYQQADLFVAPSRYESFGLMFVEAMANGLPVVALRAPGAQDLIRNGETGLLAPPEAPGALAQCLVSLCADRSLRLRLGQQARLEAETRYSSRALAEASLACYTRLVANSK